MDRKNNNSRYNNRIQNKTPNSRRTVQPVYISRRGSVGSDSRSRRVSANANRGRKVISINDVKTKKNRTSSVGQTRSKSYRTAPSKTAVHSSRTNTAPRTTVRTGAKAPARTSVRTAVKAPARTTARTTTARTARKPAPTRKKPIERRKVSGIGYEGAAQVFMIFFLLLSVLYIGGNVIRYALKSAVSYDTVQIGSIDTPKSAEGLIIRSETPYKTTMAGTVSFLVPDGEKVVGGETICTVKASDAVDEAEKSIADIDENIINREQAKQEIDSSNETAKRINLEIKALSDDAAMSFVRFDTEALRDFSNNASVKQEMRDQAILNSAGESAEISGERQRAQEVISKNSLVVTASEGGIMCLETDGFEESLTPETMESLTQKDIKKSSESSHVAGAQVAEGESIFKILTSNVWYIAAYIDSGFVADWEKGDKRTIYITDSMGEKQDMDVIVDTIEPGNKTTFVILRASKYIIDHMYLRNITFEIDKVKTGYKISNSSIVENTLIKIPAKYVSDGAVTKQNGTKVTVGDVTGEFAYFPVGYDTLVLHDIVLNPNDPEDAYELSQVETRDGVYIMNTGIAQFYTIDLTDSTSNSTHTILSPEKNPNISIYDRVITDPKNIEANDMLYK